MVSKTMLDVGIQSDSVKKITEKEARKNITRSDDFMLMSMPKMSL